ncbi:transposase [Streptomyces sp. 372A]
MIDAIAFKYRTGTPWMELPEHLGSWKEAQSQLRNWAAYGTWEMGFTALLAQADAEGDLDWAAAVDAASSAPTSVPPGRVKRGWIDLRLRHLV